MHDEISKFLSELNGIYIRYLGAEKNPCRFPYVFTKVGGGLSASGLVSHLVDEIGDILEVQESALALEISKYEKDKRFASTT